MPQSGLLGDSVVKNPPANAGDAGDMGSIPGPGITYGGGHGHPLQYLKHTMHNLMANPRDCSLEPAENKKTLIFSLL